MKFKPQSILYDEEDFKIAWGLWDNNDECLGMRWTGYPFERGGDEAWLVIPDNLGRKFIQILIGENGANNANIINVLQNLYKQELL